ncbi:MAG: NADH-quinone oxidoreductase subunit NuoE [candidate division NC10 bacterium]|nr:NADH-quinone oxidoreductase subunit NuoE [candidate division NC10 bacterium]
MTFGEQAEREFAEILTRYPDKRSALLPSLHLVQREQGYLSPPAMEEVARRLNLQPVEVLQVATFYTWFNLKPVGRHRLQVCHNLSCTLVGAERIIATLEEELKIGENETTPDGLFTLQRVECLASCGTAPMMQVNEDYHENLTPEKVRALLAQWRAAANGR